MQKQNESYKIFNDIKNGFSLEKILNQHLYFKHLTLSEHFDCIHAYEEYKIEAEDLGLETESQKIKNAIAGGWWKAEYEEKIALLQQTITNLNKTKDKLLYPSQKKQIEQQIRQNDAVLITFIKSRNEIVDYTAEKYAISKYNDYILTNFIFTDRNLTCKFFDSEDNYLDLPQDFLEKVQSYITKHDLIFNVDAMKILAATGFFQNLLFLSDDCGSSDFWGKPVTECTQRQNDLLLYGKMYRGFIKNQAENGKQIPDEIIQDPEKFINFFENQNSKNSNKFKFNKAKNGSDKNKVSSYVGATNEDLKDLGVKIEKVQGKSLLQLANESGGIIEKSDYLSAREK